MANYFNSILETIGNTPIVRINRLAPPGIDLFVKVESFNPMGSVKDRMALSVIQQAERDGLCGEGLSTGPDHGGELQRRAPQDSAFFGSKGRFDASRTQGERDAGQGS
jgi:hypothetical protein